MSWTDVDFATVSPAMDIGELLADFKHRHPTPILLRVKMEKRGNEYLGLCPFVPETSPSFTLYRKADGWRAKCFGCGWAGDVVDFVKQHDRVSFQEALERIQAELKDLPDEQEKPPAEKQLLVPPSALPRLTQRLLTDERGLAFLKSRGITPKIAKLLHLGLTAKAFAPGSKPQLALCIPRFDREGKLLGVKYRALEPRDKGSKWLQEPGSIGDFLYAPLPAKGDTLFIFEGELDCALALSLGVDAACYFGTAGVPSGNPSPRFLASLEAIKARGQKIVIVPDSDDVGRAAAARLQQQLGTGKIIHLPEGIKDFGEFWQRDPENAKEWLAATAARMPDGPVGAPDHRGRT